MFCLYFPKNSLVTSTTCSADRPNCLSSAPPGPDGRCDYRVWYDFPGELLQTPGDMAPYPAAPGLRVAFRRRMPPMAGDVQMDAFLRLPFVLEEPWED